MPYYSGVQYHRLLSISYETNVWSDILKSLNSVEGIEILFSEGSTVSAVKIDFWSVGTRKSSIPQI